MAKIKVQHFTAQGTWADLTSMNTGRKRVFSTLAAAEAAAMHRSFYWQQQTRLVAQLESGEWSERVFPGVFNLNPSKAA